MVQALNWQKMRANTWNQPLLLCAIIAISMNGASESVAVILLEGRWEAMISKHLPISLYPAICPVREIRLIVVWLPTIYVWYAIVILRMRVSSRRKVFNRHRLHRDSSFTTMVRQAFSVVRTGWWHWKGIPLTYGALKFIRKITVTDVIKVMAPCRLWGKEIPCHVPEAALCRRDGTGIVCRVQLPFICLSTCLIVHWKERLWHVPKRISPEAVL